MLHSKATREHDGKDSLDVTAPEESVEIQIRADGAVLWIHIDGRTLCRICRIPAGKITMQDDRPSSLQDDEIKGLRAFKQSVDEALNSGDGTYRP